MAPQIQEMSAQIQALYDLVTDCNVNVFKNQLATSGWSNLPAEFRREICRLRKINKSYIMTTERRERLIFRLTQALSIYSSPPPRLEL